MSYKGSSWKKHKYVKKFNNRYYYSLDAYIRRHKEELAGKLEEDIPKLDRTIKKQKKSLNTYIQKTPEKDLNIKIPKIDFNKIKMTPEMKAVGKEKFNEMLSTAKGINNEISGALVDGVKSFNKLLAKIF